MMTKKDYERAAEIVSKLVWPEDVTACRAFIKLFEGDNPKFDKDRFKKACYLNRPEDMNHDE